MAKRVLYIEDNRNNLVLLSRVVRAAGYDMLQAERGEDGVAIAEAELPELVFVDLNLPDINGIEVIRRIRNHPGLAEVPIAVLTAYGSSEVTEQQAWEAGCNEYMRKPANVDLLEQVLLRYLGPAEPGDV